MPAFRPMSDQFLVRNSFGGQSREASLFYSERNDIEGGDRETQDKEAAP